MTIKAILQVFLIFASLYVFLMGVVKGFSGNEAELILVVSVQAYLLVLIGIINIRKIGKAQEVLLLIVSLSIVWIVVRSLFIVADYESVNYQYILPADITSLSFTIFMIMLSTIFLCGGVIVGYSFQKSEIKKSHVSSNEIYFITVYFVLTLLWSISQKWLLGSQDGSSTLVSLIAIIFSPDIMLLLFVSTVVYVFGNLSKMQRYTVLGVLVFFVIARVSVGSKGGVFVLFVLFLIALLSYRSQIAIPKRALGILALLFPISILLFFVGHGIRLYYSEFSDSGLTLSSIISKAGVIWSYSTNLEGQQAGTLVEMLSRRLSMLDYLYVCFNATPTGDQLGLVYQMKAIVNIIFPGLPFEEAKYFSARLFKVAYGIADYRAIVDNYHTDMLPVFGWLFLNLGSISIVALFLFGTIVGFFYRKLCSVNTKYSFFYRIMFLYFFADLVFGMGLDSTMQQFIIFSIIPFSLYRIVKYFYSQLSRILVRNMKEMKVS